MLPDHGAVNGSCSEQGAMCDIVLPLLACLALFTSSCSVEMPSPKEAPLKEVPRAEETTRPRLSPAVESALLHADRVELLSLRPRRRRSAGSFHGWEVLGRTSVEDAPARRELIASVLSGVTESDGGIGLCFQPRHGIRATRGDQVADLVLCFACLRIEAHLNDKTEEDAPTTGTPAAVLDRVLRTAGIPLAPKE
jgi:hypothetical protein